MNATEITILVVLFVFSAVMSIAFIHALNGIHKTAKEMKDYVKRYEEKYGKKESDNT